jgi:large subunit ribosomal protein L10
MQSLACFNQLLGITSKVKRWRRIVDRSEKEQLVTSLRQGLADSSLVIVAQQTGLTVAEVSDLRRQMREAGAQYKVTKNTLARLAVAGTQNEGLNDFLSGPTALAYSKDPVAAAKVTIKFANSNDKFNVIGGALDGKVLSNKDIETLSKLPSLDELRAKILGILSTSATRVAGVLQAPAGQLARVFSAYGNKA